MNPARWSVNNRVAVNILAIALLGVGFYLAIFELRRDVFPDVSTNFIRIQTIDATTSAPEDIEQLITIPIEEEVANAQGVLNTISFSQDNISDIFLEIDPRIDDLDPVLNDVRQEVSRARAKLPASAEESVVREFDIPLPLMTLGVVIPPGYRIEEIRPELDRLMRELRLVPGVSEVFVDGLRDREIWVETDPLRADALGVSLAEISQAVSQRNRDWVGGRMETLGGERIVRVRGEIEIAEALESLPVRVYEDRVLRLNDLAWVKDTMEKEQRRGRINLNSAVSYTIIKKRGTDAMKTADEVRRVFNEAALYLPADLERVVTSDATKYIDIRIQTVVQNGIQALVVVTVLLVMFLNWRLALLIAIGVPISFAGSFIVLYMMGETMNLLSLFALIMALGMIVDDALVIAENVYRYYEKGSPPVEAAINGTGEVIWPVLGSVATTVAAFLPLILGEGIIGKFLFVIPVVVVSGLAFSLVQAFVILPSHLCDFVRLPETVAKLERRRKESPGPVRKLYLSAAIVYAEVRAAVNYLIRRIIEVYTYFLKICLRCRYAVIGGFMLLLAGSAGLFNAGIVRFELFSSDYADQVFVKLDFPVNYSLDQTESVVRNIERDIFHALPVDDLFGISTQMGSRLDDTDQFVRNGANLAMITVDIDERNPESRLPSAIMRDIRRVVERYPEMIRVSVEAQEGGPPVGRAVNVQIMGDEFGPMREIATEIEGRLGQMEGIVNIGNDYAPGTTEYVFELDEEKAFQSGLDTAVVGRALQGAYRGLEASRIRWGNDEVTIRVKMEERLQRDPDILLGMRVINDRGEPVSLASVADLVQSRGMATIIRRNQLRVLTVTADVDTRVITSREANSLIEDWIPEFAEVYPGYRFNLAGENEDTQRSLEAMRLAAMLAVLMIYVILAVIFNAFLQPLIVMSVIPFGIIGVFGGLLFMNEPLGLMAIMGAIALSGIVVNNSVVFVHFINRRRAEATRSDISPEHVRFVRWHSIIHSGRVRLRPIVLTTATTIGGLFGLAFLTRGQEQFLAPMAQAIIFGLIFATMITMILIPSFYAVIDDLKRLFVRGRP